ncbi:MAG: hypothetical protein ACXWMV_06835, partial [Syntrophales bacterium]
MRGIIDDLNAVRVLTIEEILDHPDQQPLIKQPARARSELRRIRWDTWAGMTFSNFVALAIMISTAATL